MPRFRASSVIETARLERTSAEDEPPQREWQSTGVVIRKAERADLETLMRLQADLFRMLRRLRPVYYRSSPRAPALARRYFQTALESPDWAVYLAEDPGGEVVGFAALFLFHRPGLYGGGLEAHIDDLYVVPAFRHQGVGEGLMEVAGIWATAMGAERLTLWVESNNRSAQHFYADHGFHEYEKFMALELDQQAS